MTARILCVRVVAFAATVAGRTALGLGPLAVVRGEGSHARIADLDAAAECAGVPRGVHPTQAQAICPDLRLVRYDVEALRAAGEEVETLLRTISPQVDAEGDGVFLLGCRGLSRLFRPSVSMRQRGAGVDDAELGLLEELAHRLQSAGWSARLGLADTAFVALAAASGAGEWVERSAESRPVRVRLGWPGERIFAEVVVQGGGPAYLAALPLDVLPVKDALTERWRALGLRTIGDFAALPAASVESRYGLEGLRAHQLARGEDRHVLGRAVPDEALVARVEVSAERIEELESALRPALESSLAELGARQCSAATVEFRLGLDDGTQVARSITPARPTLRAATFLELLRLELARVQLPARVVEAQITILEEHRGASRQGTLFGGDEESGEHGRLEAVLTWLRALYGEDAVGRPCTRSAQRPERRMLRESYRTQMRPVESRARTDTLAPVLRILDPPLSLDVELESGRPRTFHWYGGRFHVRTLVGPERRSGEWWGDAYDREYYEALTRDAGLFWVFRECGSGRWFLQGIFD